MTTERQWPLCLLLVFIPAAPAWAEPTEDAKALAAKVDQYLAARWQAAGAKPAAAADDAEFLRRVSLDLTGTIPPVSEVRAFLADSAPDKRRRLIDRLLDSPLYVSHFTNVWRLAWLGDGAEVDNLGIRPGFEAWLRARLTANVGYDRMVREILTSAPAVDTAASKSNLRTASESPSRARGVSPAGFYPSTKTSRRSWPAARPSCSWRCGWNAPSATTTPSPSGRASSSGSTPPSSPAPRAAIERQSRSRIWARRFRRVSPTAAGRTSRRASARASSWPTGRLRLTTRTSPARRSTACGPPFRRGSDGAGGRPAPRGRQE